MTEQEAIKAHLTTNYISQNGMTFISGLCGGLKDARKISGRHMDTGDKFPDNSKCSKDDNGPYFRGHLGSWLGTMGYLALLDQIGKCYKPKSKAKITGSISAIKKCLKYFTTLSDDEIDIIYALRNAFFHDYSIFNKYNGKNNFFHLGHHPTKPIVKAPAENWDGNYNNVKLESQTWANLEAIGDLVEKIYEDLQQLALTNQLDIELDGGHEELFRRYIFVSSEKVK
ncbi:MAG TPA: hypothetical protein DHV29_01525 [Bacteroidales bacterium]|nr:hypothetical protein [Bacteroidales bacterium]HCY22147.1 hypothetical protein [Bacteroidales bacterium]